MEKQLDQFNTAPTISQRQFWVMLAATAILLALLLAIFFEERSKEWQLRVEQASHRLALAEEIIARDLNRVRADLLFVAALPEVRQARVGDAESLREVAAVFSDFVKNQKTYSQVRLIGRTGMEVARVDWDGENSKVTKPQSLQDKSERYYVADSLRLELGQIFTSEFDLNLENGEIERPLKPVIRFVTPVPQDGEAGSLLVFNYQGSSLLNELSEISLPGETYLIRADGEFLLGPDVGSAWGWLLGHSQNFPNMFDETELVKLLNSVSPIQTRDGMFLSTDVKFGHDICPPNLVARELFSVAHIGSHEAFEASQKLLYRLLLVGGVMLIPLALVTRFWAAAINRREMQNRRIAESERRLRQLSAQLVGLQEEERRSLSREIHDSLGQQATAINLNLRMLKDKQPIGPALEGLIRESDELLKSLHGFATRVRPAELDDLGLKVALESHVAEFESRAGIACELTARFEDEDIDGSVATHVFRIVQESLNNIAKHSDATVACVGLIFDPVENDLQLSVSDDGVGMEVESNTKDLNPTEIKLGMLGMRERVDLLNGVIHVKSSTEIGTKLEIQIPLSQSREGK